MVVVQANEIITNSKNRTGRPVREGSPMIRKTKTSTPVRSTADHRGSFGKRRERPIAEPSNSARSVLMMATSQST